MAAPATILAVVNVALFCKPRTYAVIAVYTLAMVAVNTAVYSTHGGYAVGLPPRLLIAAASIGLGVVARGQRRKLEAEQQHRVEFARAAERARIAREMHDVLAHRLSLLSVHAGALEFHPDAEPAEVARAAGVIRASAHAALGELRQVIGLLRDHVDDGGANLVTEPERPQPTLKDLTQLVEESREAGMSVTFDLRLEHPEAVPDSTARAAYRVVQEGLTNARKHAPASAVEVEIARDDDGALTVTVLSRPPTNGSARSFTATPAAVAPPLSLPGTGTGLIGLAERVTLAGGGLAHAPTPDGGYALRARLPLPA
jgi:signal transduction histidine kinase